MSGDCFLHDGGPDRFLADSGVGQGEFATAVGEVCIDEEALLLFGRAWIEIHFKRTLSLNGLKFRTELVLDKARSCISDRGEGSHEPAVPHRPLASLIAPNWTVEEGGFGGA